MSQTGLPSNTSKIRTPSKVPVPSPLSRFSRNLTPSPLRTTPPSVEKPLPSTPDPFNTPTRAPGNRIASSIQPHKDPQRQSLALLDPNKQVTNPGTGLRPRDSTKSFTYVSADGSRYGPKLSIAKDADRIILGKLSTAHPVKSVSKLAFGTPAPLPTPTKEVPRAVPLHSTNRSINMKPLPSPPKASLLPSPLRIGKDLRDVAKPPKNTGRGRNGIETEISVAIETAAALLDRAVVVGKTKADTEEQEKLISAAKELVQAIISARDAEICVLQAQEALTAANVLAMQAEIEWSVSQRLALEKANQALKRSAI